MRFVCVDSATALCRAASVVMHCDCDFPCSHLAQLFFASLFLVLCNPCVACTLQGQAGLSPPERRNWVGRRSALGLGDSRWRASVRTAPRLQQLRRSLIACSTTHSNILHNQPCIEASIPPTSSQPEQQTASTKRKAQNAGFEAKVQGPGAEAASGFSNGGEGSMQQAARHRSRSSSAPAAAGEW